MLFFLTYIVNVYIVSIFCPVDVKHGGVRLDRADDYPLHARR